MRNELKIEDLEGFKLNQIVASQGYSSGGGGKKMTVEYNVVEGTHLFSIYSRFVFINSTYDLTQAIEIYNSI